MVRIDKINELNHLKRLIILKKQPLSPTPNSLNILNNLVSTDLQNSHKFNKYLNNKNKLKKQLKKDLKNSNLNASNLILLKNKNVDKHLLWLINSKLDLDTDYLRKIPKASRYSKIISHYRKTIFNSASKRTPRGVRFLLGGRINTRMKKMKFRRNWGRTWSRVYSSKGEFVQKSINTKWGVWGLKVWLKQKNSWRKKDWNLSKINSKRNEQKIQQITNKL